MRGFALVVPTAQFLPTMKLGHTATNLGAKQNSRRRGRRRGPVALRPRFHRVCLCRNSDAGEPTARYRSRQVEPARPGLIQLT
jgi:hypothetical protein